MARISINLPEIGADPRDQVTFAAWLVKLGDRVVAGQEIAELITDKATFSLEAPAAGRIVKMQAKANTTVTADQVLAEMDAD